MFCFKIEDYIAPPSLSSPSSSFFSYNLWFDLNIFLNNTNSGFRCQLSVRDLSFLLLSQLYSPVEENLGKILFFKTFLTQKRKQIHFLGCKNISNYRFYLIWFSKKPHLKIKRRHFINSFSNEVPSAKTAKHV